MSDNIGSERRGRHAESESNQSKQSFHISSFWFSAGVPAFSPARREKLGDKDSGTPCISIAPFFFALWLRHGRCQIGSGYRFVQKGCVLKKLCRLGNPEQPSHRNCRKRRWPLRRVPTRRFD